MLVVLSHYQAASLLLARRDGQTRAHVSLDLNLSTSVVQLDEAGVGLAGWPAAALVGGGSDR
jgi:hypothetical protein